MEQKTKHTPGPWEVTGPHSREVITTNSGTYKPCMTIAKVGGYWDGEAQANAHLIAAAPAMYQELVNQRDWLLHIMKQVQAPASVMLGFEQSIKYLNLTIAQAERK